MSSPPLPRNGCYNRWPLTDSVIVQTGWGKPFKDGAGIIYRTALHAEIDNPMSKDCQYSKTTRDERCDGCAWKQGGE